MKQVTQNTFTDGLVMDMNPLLTPPSALTDAVNATLLTFNGTEFTLQADSGNVKIEDSQIDAGFLPVGIKEYEGIIYLALLNPATGNCQIGSIPSPVIKIGEENSFQKDISYTASVNTSNNSVSIELFDKDEFLISPGDIIKLNELPTEDGTFSKSNLYSYQYYIMDENNQIYPFEFDLNKEFYYNKSVKGTIVLYIKLNNIETFNASGNQIRQMVQSDDGTKYKCSVNVNCDFENKIDTSKNLDESIYVQEIKYELYDEQNKKIKDGIKTVNTSTLNSTDDLLNSLNFNLDLSEDFPQDKDFSVILKLTPINNYGHELDYLTKTINLTFLLTNISVGVSIFQHYLNQNTFNIRFNYNYNLADTLSEIWIELYDVWSNFSIIKKAVISSNVIDFNITFDIDNTRPLTEYDIVNFNQDDPNADFSSYYKNEFADSDKAFLGAKRILTTDTSLRMNNLYIAQIHAKINNQVEHSENRPLIVDDYLNQYYKPNDNLDFSKLSNKRLRAKGAIELNFSKTTDGDYVDTHNLVTTKRDNKTYFYKLQAQTNIIIDPSLVFKGGSAVTNVINLVQTSSSDKLDQIDQINRKFIPNYYSRTKEDQFTMKHLTSSPVYVSNLFGMIDLSESTKLTGSEQTNNLISSNISVLSEGSHQINKVADSNALFSYTSNQQFLVSLKTEKKLELNKYDESKLIKNQPTEINLWDTLYLNEDNEELPAIGGYYDYYNQDFSYVHRISTRYQNRQNYISSYTGYLCCRTANLRELFKDICIDKNKYFSGAIYDKNNGTTTNPITSTSLGGYSGLLRGSSMDTRLICDFSSHRVYNLIPNYFLILKYKSTSFLEDADPVIVLAKNSSIQDLKKLLKNRIVYSKTTDSQYELIYYTIKYAPDASDINVTYNFKTDLDFNIINQTHYYFEKNTNGTFDLKKTNNINDILNLFQISDYQNYLAVNDTNLQYSINHNPINFVFQINTSDIQALIQNSKIDGENDPLLNILINDVTYDVAQYKSDNPELKSNLLSSINWDGKSFYLDVSKSQITSNTQGARFKSSATKSTLNNALFIQIYNTGYIDSNDPLKITKP